MIIFIKAYKRDLIIVFGFLFATFAIFIHRHNIILIRLIHQSIMMLSYKYHQSSGFFSAFLFAIIYWEIMLFGDFQIPFKIYRHKYLGSKYLILSIMLWFAKMTLFELFFYKKYFKIKIGHFYFVQFRDSQKSFEKNVQLAYCDSDLIFLYFEYINRR